MDKELTFVEHFEELRRRIIISLAAVAATSASAFAYAPRLLEILKAPGSGMIDRLVFFSPAEAFMVHIRIAFFAGAILSMPVILYQLWAFLSPAFETGEKRRGLSFLFFSTAVFVLGASFAFFLLLPAALKFLLGFAKDGLEPLISVSSYISFVSALVLGSGLVFEMPVLSWLLSKLGVIDHRILRKGWGYAVIFIFIAAAVVTPTPDVFGMFVLALPMLLLYEVSIWISRLSGRKIKTLRQAQGFYPERDRRIKKEE